MERTYFLVYFPKESKDSSKPMFFCSKWSVGKVVDYAASLANLKNNNNVQAAMVMGAYWSLRPLTQHLKHHCLLIILIVESFTFSLSRFLYSTAFTIFIFFLFLAQKLRLCHPQTGEAFQMDDTLLSILAHPEAPLYNGGDVILEYLDNECTHLEDVAEYITQAWQINHSYDYMQLFMNDCFCFFFKILE